MKSRSISDENIKIDVRSLFDFSNVVNQDVTIDFIINSLLLTIMGKLTCNKAIVFLKDEKNNFYIKNAKGFILKNENKIFKLSRKYVRLSYLSNFKNNKDKFIVFLRKNRIQLFLPLLNREKILGYVALSKFNNKKLSDIETNYLKSIVNITASALQQKFDREELRRLNRDLDHKIHQMNTLFDLSKEFAATLQREKLIRLLTLSLMGQLGISKFAIFIKENGVMRPIITRAMDNIDCEFLDNICYIRKPILVSEVKKIAVRKVFKQNKVKAIVPMVSHDEVKGLLLLGEKLSGNLYSQADLEFLYSLSNIAIISLENTRLFIEAIEKQKIEDELQIAKGIQQGLFPRELPKHKNLDISAINIPSKIVGGDYYDVLDMGDEKYALAIADVSGKGIPAALLMASIQSSLHTLIKLNLSPAELVQKINELIYDNTSIDRFITFFLGVIDMKTKTIKYVNAGHNYPIYLKHDGRIYRLEKGGLLLGITRNFDYEDETVTLEKEDLICIFTDGITEARNSELVEFEEERLIKILNESIKLSSEEIKDKIIREVQSFCNGNQTDDITLVLVKIK